MALFEAQTLRNRLRLGSGIVMFVFVTGHLINHMFGLVSIGAMQDATGILLAPWRTWPGTILLAGAFLVHIYIAVSAFWRRRTFRLKRWEMVQLFFGLAIPPLLAAHVAANGVLPEISTFDSSYIDTLATFAVYAPWRGIMMGFAIIVVWTHACVGLRSVLRLQPWYPRYRPVAFALAIIVPAVSLAGYLAAAMRTRQLAVEPGGLQAVYTSTVQPWMIDFVYDTEKIVVALMLLLLAARAIKGFLSKKTSKARLTYSPGDRKIDLHPGATLLESIRAAGIPHASICGGRGRCSTCRIRIGRGLDDLPPPEPAEQKVLTRVAASPSVRLACQIRPHTSMDVVALVPGHADADAVYADHGYQQGQERKIAVLFADLRGSTKLCEDRLPFDVVFVLNQFFAELAQALKETNGHYAQFNGDGLMAIYGLESGAEKGAAEAVHGARAMLARLEKLNEKLRGELSEDLQIGIGIHTGEAIVGSMGPPASPNISALGDNVNVAARLEAQTKEFGVPLVVSVETAELSGIDFSGFRRRRVRVRGREQTITVYAVDAPQILPLR
ncbi:MAG: 2Fe-2S iron-sulfur cluster-binding protein [Hyphomicrobiaceae bacterium]|nr:2Fe-2S iron-sulfur cluster-binding protein [Hyphomicrobiaceae bacterium]